MSKSLGRLFAVLLALTLVSAACGSSAKSDADALFAKGICANQASPSCAPYKEKINAERTDSTISVVGYVTGGVLIATGAVLFFAWPKAERQKAMIVPAVGPNSACLTLQGRF